MSEYQPHSVHKRVGGHVKSKFFVFPIYSNPLVSRGEIPRQHRRMPVAK